MVKKRVNLGLSCFRASSPDLRLTILRQTGLGVHVRTLALPALTIFGLTRFGVHVVHVVGGRVSDVRVHVYGISGYVFFVRVTAVVDEYVFREYYYVFYQLID